MLTAKMKTAHLSKQWQILAITFAPSLFNLNITLLNIMAAAALHVTLINNVIEFI